jgi:folate-binding Fe-S cluster repair protein YgfZ
MSAADLAAGFVAPVTDLGLIAVAGEDAARFLHSQLTNDVEHLGTGEARLAGFCTPKGRLQATFLMWRDAETTGGTSGCNCRAPSRRRCRSACRCS